MRLFKILVSQNDLFLTLGSGTSSARNENLRPLLNTNIPLVSGNRNHFGTLESRFLLRKSEKRSIFSNLFFPQTVSPPVDRSRLWEITATTGITGSILTGTKLS